jgi:hypothetical protein
MSGAHPSEEALQEYALDRLASSPVTVAHVEGCPECGAAVAAYASVMEGLKIQPKPVFGFDLAGAVIREIKAGSAEKRKRSSVPMAVVIALGAGIPAWLFRKSAYFVFTDMSAVFYGVLLGIAGIVVGLFILRLHKKYQDVINLINK